MTDHEKGGFWRGVEDVLGRTFANSAKQAVHDSAKSAWKHVGPVAEKVVLGAEDLMEEDSTKRAGYGAAGAVKGGAAAKALLSKGILGKLLLGAAAVKAAPVIVTAAVIGGGIAGVTKGPELHKAGKDATTKFKKWRRNAREKRDGPAPS